MKMQRELVIIPGIAKRSATGFLVTDLSVIGSLKTDPSETGPSVTGLSGTGLNDHELVHEAEGIVDEPAVKNCRVAEWANWAAEFFRDTVEFESVVAPVL